MTINELNEQLKQFILDGKGDIPVSFAYPRCDVTVVENTYKTEIRNVGYSEDLNVCLMEEDDDQLVEIEEECVLF